MSYTRKHRQHSEEYVKSNMSFFFMEICHSTVKFCWGVWFDAERLENLLPSEFWLSTLYTRKNIHYFQNIAQDDFGDSPCNRKLLSKLVFESDKRKR